MNFHFRNVKLPYESYKGDYAIVKYFVKIIIIATYKNAEYEKEFAVVNPNDNSILQNKDEPIRMQVGMKQKISLSIYFQHKNYNCRGTLKGFIIFNYLNIPLKFMEVQIVRREVIFGEKKCEPAYVARYELIDGIPLKNERIPIRFFLKSYNLTPTYNNVGNIFYVRYFLNLVIADEEDNRFFKQKEICLFRLFKQRRNYHNNNYNYSENEYYNNNEEFVTEPIYEEDFSIYYRPKVEEQNNNNIQNDNYYDEGEKYEINQNIPSINEDESYDYGYNKNSINYNTKDIKNNNNINNNRFNDNNNQISNYNNYDMDNRNNNYNNNINNNNSINNRNNKKSNNINNNISQNNNINNNYNNKGNSVSIFDENYYDDEDENNYNDNYGKNENNINNGNSRNYYNENDYNQNNSGRQNMNNNNKNSKGKNEIRINNPNEPKGQNQNNNFRSNLMKSRISNEEDIQKIFNSLDNIENKEELKKNIFG